MTRTRLVGRIDLARFCDVRPIVNYGMFEKPSIALTHLGFVYLGYRCIAGMRWQRDIDEISGALQALSMTEHQSVANDLKTNEIIGTLLQPCLFSNTRKKSFRKQSTSHRVSSQKKLHRD